jgi:hypothetical protein
MQETSFKQAAIRAHAGFLHGLAFNTEDGGKMFPRNIG